MHYLIWEPSRSDFRSVLSGTPILSLPLIVISEGFHGESVLAPAPKLLYEEKNINH